MVLLQWDLQLVGNKHMPLQNASQNRLAKCLKLRFYMIEVIQKKMREYIAKKVKQYEEIEELKQKNDLKEKLINKEAIDEYEEKCKRSLDVPIHEIPFKEILSNQEIKNKNTDLDIAWIANLIFAKVYRVEERNLKLISFLIDYTNDKDIQKFEERVEEVYQKL